MNALVVLSLAVAAALAEPRPGYLGATTYAAGLGIHAAPLTLPAASVLAPAVSSQFHAQDELGQYHYGYSGGPSAKEEIRTADGSVAGAYSYVDAHGIVQSAHYVSDPVNGFRVAATNLPVGPAAPAPAVVAAAPAPAVAVAAAPAVVADTPEVAAAKAAHFNAHLAAKAAVLGRKKRSPGFLSAAAPAAVLSTPAATALAAPVAYASPTVVVAPARSFAYSAVAAHGAQVVPAGPVAAYAAAAPVVAAAPAAHVVAAAPATVAYSAPAPVAYSAPAAAAVVPVAASSQYRVQDELGQYTYGYADGNSAKTESRAADGSTVGGYSYVDGNGLVQSVKYHADSLGFRVAATNLPVGPA
ncbi:ice-structuring glycoprotein-like [Schistocerca piceifrons]|uniref:ice-structuring glycoprotein-like n=1 Tax=Schistocerca piceifrons TaxID=274613 RepID=UPI001F5F3CFC|nr:ice-structuring glycoprotein-like [Schistocerca piceifrons]